jgi:hypothetical protein
LPTGAGKTAVMMALAFELGARRIFILTPSMFSREQTATEFRSQRQLSDHIGALKRNLEYGPRVKENESDITSDDDWRKFLSFDVVVSTANAILSPPPPDSGRTKSPTQTPACMRPRLVRRFCWVTTWNACANTASCAASRWELSPRLRAR